VVKPHFAVLLFLYLLRGQFKTLIKGVLLGGTIHVLAFLVVAGDRFPINIYDSLVRIVAYANLSSVETGWPQNISYAQSLYSFAHFFRGEQKSTIVLEFLATHQGLIGPIILLAVLLLITVFRANLTNVQATIIITSLIVMTSSTTYYYYAIFAIPALLAVTEINENSKNSRPSEDSEQTLTSKRINFILWLALALTLVQLPIYPLDSNEVIIATTANLVGGVWIAAYILIFSALLKARTQNKIETKIYKRFVWKNYH
jgi:hypothetical protein